MNEFKKKVSDYEKQQKKQEAEQDKDLEEKARLEDDIDHAKRTITNCKRQLNSYRDNPAVEKQAKLEEARRINREVIEEKQRKMTEVDRKIQEAKEEVERILPNIEGAKAAFQQYENHIKTLERERDEIRRRSSAKENKFGAYAREIAQKIAANRWNYEPVGPIGNYIDIQGGYEKYAGVVERQIANALHGYIVFTHEDKIRLSK